MAKISVGGEEEMAAERHLIRTALLALGAFALRPRRGRTLTVNELHETMYILEQCMTELGEEDADGA